MQYGPDYDFATRLRRIEDYLSRQMQNQIGQALSTTQSDGSIGIQIGQDSGGAAGLTFRQGPGTPRDASTDQHDIFAYLGQIYSGGTLEDAGALFYRPDGSQSQVIGNRGTQIIDPHGHQVVTTDEYGSSPSQIGLNTPWLNLGQPQPLDASKWPQTTSTSLAEVSLLAFPAQHAQISWYGTTYCPAGTTGEVQVTVNNGAAGATHAVGAGFTNIGPETIPLGSGLWSWQEMLQVIGNAQVTSASGYVAFMIYGVWGAGSGF